MFIPYIHITCIPSQRLSTKLPSRASPVAAAAIEMKVHSQRTKMTWMVSQWPLGPRTAAIRVINSLNSCRSFMLQVCIFRSSFWLLHDFFFHFGVLTCSFYFVSIEIPALSPCLTTYTQNHLWQQTGWEQLYTLLGLPNQPPPLFASSSMAKGALLLPVLESGLGRRLMTMAAASQVS